MPSREMTLEEWVTRLPWSHRARQEFEAMRAAHQERDADAREAAMPRSEHGISAADVLNETARILEAPIETDPLRELRVVLNARLQTHAVQQDRAIRAGRLAAERFHEGAVTGLTYAIEQIDAWLALQRIEEMLATGAEHTGESNGSE